MNARQLLTDGFVTALVAFVVVAVVTFLYSLVTKGAGQVDWETAFVFAIVLGIVLPLTRALGRSAA